MNPQAPDVLAALPLAAAMRRRTALHPSWHPLPHQVPPDGDWTAWALVSGRGSGKTWAGAHFVDEHARGPACVDAVAGGHRIAIIAPTLADARETCVTGTSGIRAANPTTTWNANRGVLTWPNGSEARIFGAYAPEDPERLRGPQHCLVWAEELAAWRQLDGAWDMMTFGLRVGERPRVIVTTTPKPRPRIKDLLADPSTSVTRASTADNPHLAEVVRTALVERYGGTRLGRQELDAELLLDVPGALWTWEMIEAHRRLPADAPEMSRVVVVVDPAATSAEDADETAIAVCGRGVDGDFYVIAADGYRVSPHGWATRALDAFDRHGADSILAEVNNGGEMVVATIRNVRPTAPVRVITATRGKALRAEPVAALYEQARVHHLGVFEVLEDQLTTFPVSNEHDDRLDAVVYGLTDLTLGVSPAGATLAAPPRSDNPYHARRRRILA